MRNRPFFATSAIGRGVIIATSLSLAGCVTLPRQPYQAAAPVAPGALSPVGFGADIRFDASDPNVLTIASATRDRATQPVAVLALSGGGARGAFGAGVLVGWTQTGARPQFDLVTGVSAGALAAPFAFLGSSADSDLTKAFTDGAADDLLRWRGLRLLFEDSLSADRGLRALVEQFVSDDMLRKIAAEHAKGRRLLVVTTNLDTQATIVWDMGAIAAQGGPRALSLFVNILIASASIPGLFPPVLIEVEDAAGVRHQEMHVDGGVTTPFLAVPEAVLKEDSATPDTPAGALAIVVNGRLGNEVTTVPRRLLPILQRSFDTMQLSAARLAIIAAEQHAKRTGATVNVVSMPENTAIGEDALDFSEAAMKQTFALGVAAGKAIAAPAG